MTFAKLKGEDALDLFADIIDLADDIRREDEFMEMCRDKDNTFKAISYLVRHRKAEVAALLARLEGAEPDEYRCDVFVLPKALMALLHDPDAAPFFSLISEVIRNIRASSGAASGTTEAAEKA